MTRVLGYALGVVITAGVIAAMWFLGALAEDRPKLAGVICLAGFAAVLACILGVLR